MYSCLSNIVRLVIICRVCVSLTKKYCSCANAKTKIEGSCQMEKKVIHNKDSPNKLISNRENRVFLRAVCTMIMMTDI